MAKNNQEFAQFLKDEVELNKSRLDRLETAVGGVNGYLKDNLPGYQTMERQGSYALDTLIKPVDDNDEYDAGIQIVMNPNLKWGPKDYVLAINRTLGGNQTYADKRRLKTRCVTVDYAGDFHLDVVPRVTIGGKHYVCNRHWDQRRYANFRNRVQSYAQMVRQAKAEPSVGKAIKIWQELFGDSFGKATSSGGGTATGAGAASGAAAVRRPNEARRFG